jgi:hypothetical protein
MSQELGDVGRDPPPARGDSRVFLNRGAEIPSVAKNWEFIAKRREPLSEAYNFRDI